MKRILLLEDENLVMNLVIRILKPRPISQARTATEALQLFATDGAEIDLMIADVTLPVGSGVQVATALRVLNPYLAIILISGYPVSRWSERDTGCLRDLGLQFLSILQKPFRPQALRRGVEELIGPYEIEAATA